MQAIVALQFLFLVRSGFNPTGCYARSESVPDRPQNWRRSCGEESAVAKRKDAPRAAPMRETGLVGGVKRRAIIVVPNCSEWPRMFRQHAKRISEALGTVALGIDHIGSTAVPELTARPIIDMLFVVANSANEDSHRLPCGSAATRTRTRARGTQDVPHAGGDVHVHILSTGSPEVER